MMRRIRYFCPTLNKIGICRHILVKLDNTTFHENLFSDYRIVSCVKTDGRTERRSKLKRRSAGLRIRLKTQRLDYTKLDPRA
jgi:hypothetical protein